MRLSSGFPSVPLLPEPLIDPRRLQLLLGVACGRFTVDALAECDSTNSVLLLRAGQGAPSGSVVVADRQTAGRGSRGRRWESSPGASLTFSLLWRFRGGVHRLAGLSLAVGVAVVRALAASGAPHITLKWPNDILLDEAKLGGILVELQGEENRSLAVMGIGINLALPPDFERTPFHLPPTALAHVLQPLPERHELFARLLSELARVLDTFSYDGFAALRDEWQTYNVWQDRPVCLLREGRVVKEGVCRGADHDGALLVQTASGIERCLSGDLSLRSRS